MRHRVADKKLGISFEHRKSMLRNLALSLLKHERIVTTITKAKLVRRNAERMITWAKRGGLANIRLIESAIGDKDIISKLVKVLAPRYKDRQGGYTRILKLKNRKGDNALIAIIELVDRVKKPKKEKKGAKPGEKAAAVKEEKGKKKEEAAKK